MAISKIIYKSSAEATPEIWMDATTATAAAANIIAPYTAMLADGIVTTGTGSGGGSSYTLLDTQEISVNTTSTSTTAIPNSTMIIPRNEHYKKILYIQIRDKAGPRDGYFYGSDTFWLQPINASQVNDYRQIRLYAQSSNNVVITSTSTYGVFPNSPPTFGSDSVTISFSSRYNSSYSRTINGTYVVNVYDLEFADDDSPFDD